MLRIKKNGDEYSFSFFNARTDKVDLYDTVDSDLEQDSEQSRDYSAIGLQRAKRTIREYSLCNDWTHFVTFTFDLNKTKDNGNDNVKRLVIQTLNHYKTRYDKEFRYLLIPEYHADKQQLHFHGSVYCSDSSVEKDTFLQLRCGLDLRGVWVLLRF